MRDGVQRVPTRSAEVGAAGWPVQAIPIPRKTMGNHDLVGDPFAIGSPAVGGIVKRSFDLTGAIAAIALLLPLLVLIAAVIKLYDGGSPTFRHRRIGRGGKPFFCLKFRTMVEQSDEVLRRHLAAHPDAAHEWRASQKLKRDPRITPLGKVLRKTSVDELPQLFNILKGEMSFVGPRPIVSAEIPKYGTHLPTYLMARPGLTGAWQVSGRNDVDYRRRVELDRAYVENWNFWRDIAILVKTVYVVVATRGCY
jgi:exopolysaccharide production protein ExoY